MLNHFELHLSLKIIYFPWLTFCRLIVLTKGYGAISHKRNIEYVFLSTLLRYNLHILKSILVLNFMSLDKCIWLCNHYHITISKNLLVPLCVQFPLPHSLPWHPLICFGFSLSRIL